MNIKIRKLHPDAIVPTYGTTGAAAFDLHACTVDGYTMTGSIIYDGKPVTCGTGLAFEIPDGYAMLVLSRSGMGFRDGIRLCNAVGLIDSDYRGEVMVKLVRDGDSDHGQPDPIIHPGDRIAQAVILPVPRVEFEVVDTLAPTARDTGGFGSTGK